MLLVDLDDMTETSLEDLAMLDDIHRQIPHFKATLFAIPAEVSREFVDHVYRSRPWLQMVAHGLRHDTNRECQNWSQEQCETALAHARNVSLSVRGFKAPGWQISDDCYKVLLKLGYWVADQSYNDWRRPSGLRSYVIRETGPTMYRTEAGNPARAIHGHISHRSGHNPNALELIYDQILEAGRKDPDFRFIDQVMR